MELFVNNLIPQKQRCWKYASFKYHLKPRCNMQKQIELCVTCGKARDYKGNWTIIENFDQGKEQFRNTICVECSKSKFPQFYTSEDASFIENRMINTTPKKSRIRRLFHPR